MTTIDVACYPLVPDGPLAEWVRPFQQEMVRLGFTARTAQDNAYVMASLSRWMVQARLGPERLGAVGLEEFAGWRRDRGYQRWRSVRSLRQMLVFLRQAGLVPAEPVRQPADPVSMLVERYAGYLRRERRLQENTIAGRVAVAERFLGTLPAEGR